MDPMRRKRLLLLSLAVMVVLACNAPGLARPADNGAGPIYTAAARTVEAQMTQVSQPPPTQGTVPTFPPPTQGTVPTFAPPTLTPTKTAPPSTPLPSATKAPTQPPAACDAIKFVKDVTVPDNTLIPANAPFIKTWRLRNIGTCTWTTSYSLIFTGGDQMGAPASVALTENVAPGNAADISVNMVAPGQPGTYRANFKLRNAGGQTFGLGEDGSKPFWAQIKVGGTAIPPSGVTFDFLTNASKAEWITSEGSQAGSAIKFGGYMYDQNGSASIQDALVLENGSTSGKVLYTLPRQQNDGVISGLFPAYTVQKGDFLKGKLSLMMNPGDGCGVGNLNFQVVYMDGGSPKLLDEWTKTCTGNFIDVNIDLSPLAGKTVQFGLVVEALGSAKDDYAIWNSLRIER